MSCPARARPAQPTLRDRLAAIARGRRDGRVRGGLHGVRQRARRPARGRLLEPTRCPRAGRPGHPLRVGVLRAAAHPRGLGFTVAVSSGQELVTPAEYAEYALAQPETQGAGAGPRGRPGPAGSGGARPAAARDIPVCLLTAGGSAGGRAMVSAHSGALAAADGGWEALAAGYGVHRVGTGRLPTPWNCSRSAAARRPGRRGRRDRDRARLRLERAHVADVADELGGRSARSATDPGRWPGCSTPAWSRRTRWTCGAPARGPGSSWPGAGRAGRRPGGGRGGAGRRPGARVRRRPVLPAGGAGRGPADRQAGRVLSNCPQPSTRRPRQELRAAGVPVLEGTRSGLLALRHLLQPRPARPRPGAVGARRPGPAGPVDRGARRARPRGPRLARPAPRLRDRRGPRAPRQRGRALAAARAIGYPVVLKTDEPGIAHKSDAGGVVLGMPARPS